MATPVAWGSEFLVNTATSGAQDESSVAALSDGRFIVTWTDASSTAPDTINDAVRAQIFGADGKPLGGEFVVNTATAADQSKAVVSALPNGGFVAAWMDLSGTGGDASSFSIKAQVFSPLGVKVGLEILVNTTTANEQGEPCITTLSNGGFVVGWTDHSSTGGDTSVTAVRGQVYDANGGLVGSEILVNTTAANAQDEPVITALTHGRFVIVWTDHSATGGDTSSLAIRAQLFNADGSPRGVEFLVNTTTGGGQLDPAVTALAGGGFAVAWTDASVSAPDTLLQAVRVQVFNENGSKSGTEFVANSTFTNNQKVPAIAGLSDGRFVVVWDDFSGTGGDTSGIALKAQVFDALGQKSGVEFRVNTTVAANQSDAAVTALADGRFVVTWSDSSQSGGDTTGSAVRAQIFDPREAGITLTGGSGDDNFVGTGFADTLSGAAGNDNLVGGGGDDVLLGGKGKDKLFGEQGSDNLNGGTGKDLLDGGIGNDTLTGDIGADRFVFKPGYGSDVITAFEDNIDRIDLRAYHFASFAAAQSFFADQGSDLVFSKDGDVLTIDGFSAAQLTAGDLLI